MPRFALVLALLTACPSPVIRPLRARDGVHAQGSLSILVPAGPSDAPPNATQSGGLNPVELAVGYGHMFGDHVGVMAGVMLPAWGVAKHVSWLGLVGVYAAVTLQNDHVAISVGSELSAGGWAVTGSVDVRPWGEDLWRPGLGVIGRYASPFSPDATALGREGAHTKVPSWDIGVRLHLRPDYREGGQETDLTRALGDLFLQYTYHRQIEGDFPLLFRSFRPGAHIFTLGLPL